MLGNMPLRSAYVLVFLCRRSYRIACVCVHFLWIISEDPLLMNMESFTPICLNYVNVLVWTTSTGGGSVSNVMTSWILAPIFVILSPKNAAKPSQVWFSASYIFGGDSSVWSISLMTTRRPRASPSVSTSLSAKCFCRASLMKRLVLRHSALYERQSACDRLCRKLHPLNCAILELLKIAKF